LATGPFHAHGPIDALNVDTRLALPGGGEFGLRGIVDFKSKELGYDVGIDATALDLSQVMISGPRTAFTGGGTAKGRGFKPATMVSDLNFAFGPSRFDTVTIDSVAVLARLGNGMATVARAEVRGAGAKAAAVSASSSAVASSRRRTGDGSRRTTSSTATSASGSACASSCPCRWSC
jgi:hypothetical protein